MLAICAQGIVVVLTDRHVCDLDSNSLRLARDQFCRRIPVGVGVNASQRQRKALAILLEDAIGPFGEARAGQVLLSLGNVGGRRQVAKLWVQPGFRGWKHQAGDATWRFQACSSLRGYCSAVKRVAERQANRQASLATDERIFLVYADRVQVDGIHEDVVVCRISRDEVLLERWREVTGPIDITLWQRHLQAGTVSSG